MLDFFVNNWGTLLAGVIVLAVVILVIVKLIRDKKYDYTLLYSKDFSIFRSIMIRRFYHMAYKKYKLYFNKRGMD